MDRVQEKGKKSKPSFRDELKNLKENLKIREILRTVKMNSSMRLKAPPGSKVMDNRDFIDNENVLEASTTKSEIEQCELYVSSATNPNVIFDASSLESDKDIIDATNKNINIKDIDNKSSETSNTTSIVNDSETNSQLNKKQEQHSNIDENTKKDSEDQEVSVVSSESLTLSTSEQHPVEQPEKQSKSSSEVIEGLLHENKEEETREENEFGERVEDHCKNNSKEDPKQPSEIHLKNELEEEFTQETQVYSQEYLKDNSKNQSGDHLKEQEIKSQVLTIEHVEQSMELPEQSKVKVDDQSQEITEVQDVKQNDQQRTTDQTNIQDESQSNNQTEVHSIELLEDCSKLITEERLNEEREEYAEQHKSELSDIQLSEEQSPQQLQEPLVNQENEKFETKSDFDPEDNSATISAENSYKTALANHSNSFNDIRTNLLRNRKLSWDHTLLCRRDGLSQSEVDLHSIGKLPLERKSSFFRKKMDSFLRNTTEMFKKHSFNAKSESIQRRGSMSISLQSLNETAGSFSREYKEDSMDNQQKEETPGSMNSLISSSTLGRSNSTLSGCHSEALNPDQGSERSLVGSQPTLYVTPALGDYPSNSVHSLNESYLHDSLLKNRAISMSSGLDSQSWLRRKKSTSKSNRSNRVTWVASEGLTNYFRRMIQDENSKNIQEGQPYQDCSSIPENKSEKCYGKNDTKGRRWSYQRAVSGEDPTPPTRYQDTSLRRKPLTEHSEDNPDIARKLAEFQDTGVPKLRGFEPVVFTEEVQDTLNWAQNKDNIDLFISMEASAKQAVLCELISTEADYINHLQVMVEVFIAAAHALQDAGQMLNLATSRLFLNLPDIYNANRIFWETTFHPMIQHALANNTAFDPKLMADGFRTMADIFEPYEKYAVHHPRANDYLRALMNNIDFTTYLSWCHSQKVCQRLQISDLLVKPIQRITKYNLILKRISQLVEDEDEKSIILAMDQSAKTFVSELNRSVKQRQEISKAENSFSSIENYELDFLQANFQEFKDDEIDEYTYHMFTQSNLRAPMLNCHSQHGRTVIHEGDLRFKDGNKEIEVRAILYTDLLIICKKQSKGSPYQYKMIRPKYMIDKLVDFPKYSVRNNVTELTLIFIVMVDDFGSCHTCFTLTESSKDPNGSDTLKLWEQKIKEAQYTYNLAVWLYRNPSYHISELEQELISDYGSGGAKQKQLSQEEYNIEREAKERVVTMMHRTIAWSSSFSTDHSHVSSDIVSMSITGRDTPTGRRVPGIDVLQNRWKRASTGYSSRNSRMSSFQKSMSTASHDESTACNRQIRRAGSSVENTQSSFNKDDGLSSVTVKVMKDGEIESELSSNTNPTLGTSGQSGRSSATSNTLQVQNPVVALVHSLPDLSFVPISPGRPQRRRSPSPVSASEKLYQVHQDHLKSRLTVQNQYLTPDSRGISYPPTSPVRASLKRGLAFSYSFNKPTLTKMGHVASQNALDHIEQAPTPMPTPIPSPIKGSKERELRLEKPGFVAKYLSPGSSTDKLDKEKDKEKDAGKDKDKKSKLRRKKKDGKERTTEEIIEDLM